VVRRFGVRARYQLGTLRLWWQTVRDLRQGIQRASSPEEIVDIAFADYGPFSLWPSQVRSEITMFLRFVANERPGRVLEIGTKYGGVTLLLAWASTSTASLLSLEIRTHKALRRALFRSLRKRGQRVAVWQADSQLEETRAAVSRFFDNRPLDLLFIDGDHSFEGVRRDYELYEPLVRSGGLIAFHDIVDGPESSVGGVPRLWREFQSAPVETHELVESWTQRGYGIGVIRKTD
jgi:predicted O-methyltransferase YrrM